MLVTVSWDGVNSQRSAVTFLGCEVFRTGGTQVMNPTITGMEISLKLAFVVPSIFDRPN